MVTLTEHELTTLDRLVKLEAYDNELSIIDLENIWKDHVLLNTNDEYNQRLQRRDHLAELSCKIFGELAGVKVEVKIKNKQNNENTR